MSNIEFNMPKIKWWTILLLAFAYHTPGHMVLVMVLTNLLISQINIANSLESADSVCSDFRQVLDNDKLV